MTEVLTIPAHIENGSIRLQAPMPGDVERWKCASPLVPDDKVGSPHWSDVLKAFRPALAVERGGRDAGGSRGDAGDVI